MKNYMDDFSQYHTKEVTINNPLPTNDGFIHTAYAEKAGLPVYKSTLGKLFFQCLRDGKLFQRLPNKPLPPPSRDVVLGACALGLLKPEHIYNWNFSPFPIPRFSLIKLVKQLWEMRPSLLTDNYITLFQFFGGKSIKLPLGYNLAFKHRNYFWENGLDQIYRFAFSVPLQDRYFILQKWGKFQFYNPVHLFYKAAAFLDSKLGQASGIRFLKYGGEKNKAAMVTEFPADHPIRIKLGL